MALEKIRPVFGSVESLTSAWLLRKLDQYLALWKVRPVLGSCEVEAWFLINKPLLSLQDYPSISQVAVKAKEKNVNIIFAVTSDQKPIYDQLKPIIAGSETGVLASDSQNVVKLVRDNYLVRDYLKTRNEKTR